MSKRVNYEMSTKYIPEFKRLLSYENLYNRINQEHIGIEPDSFDAREIFTRRDSSGIFNKLKNKLHFNIKDYDKSDEERFNILKLMYFLINTNKRYDINTLKSVSVIDLIATPTLEHTDSDNSVYEEHFSNCINELKQGVSNPDYREKEVKRIHKIWNKQYQNIQYNLIEDIQFKNDDLKRISTFLKYLIDSIDLNKIFELKQPHEGVIDTFYNIMLSSRVIAEAEDNFNVIYDYSDEKNFSNKITEMLLNNSLFSEYMTWEEFENIIDIKKVNIDDEKSKMIWSVLLLKEDISADDIKSIIPADYNFAKKYTPVIAEYWINKVENKKDISVSDWIIVMQELMCISKNKIEYANIYIRHTNTKVKLTASIKNFKKSSELPKQIILRRLTNRYLLMFGTKKLFEYKIQADRCIMQLEKIIFSYKNTEDIKTAHSYLYFHTSAILSTDLENKLTLQEFENNVNKILKSHSPFIPKIRISPDPNNYFSMLIISLLSKDKSYRLLQNEKFMKIRSQGIKCISDIKDISIEDENFKKLAELNKSFHLSKTALNKLSNELAKETEYLYEISQKYIRECITSRIFSVPIYLGSGNEYYCCIRFLLYKKFNTLDIQWINFVGKDIEQSDIYKQLFLKVTD